MTTKPATAWPLFWVLIRVGATAFGGHAALLSVVHSEIVEKRRWLSDAQWARNIAVAGVIPGPFAVNVVIQSGAQILPGVGAWIAGIAIITPAALVMMLLAGLAGVLEHSQIWQTMTAALISVLVVLILKMGVDFSRKQIHHPWQWALFTLAAVAMVLLPPIWLQALLLIAGVCGWFLGESNAEVEALPANNNGQWVWFISALAVIALPRIIGMTIDLSHAPILQLTQQLSEISVLFFGGGYVMIPLLQSTVVDQLGAITQAQFVSGIALGQLTPGPIFVSNTYFGWQVAGVLGAILCTIAVFLPPAVLMLAASKILGVYQHFAHVQKVLQGLYPVIGGMIVAAAIVLVQRSDWHWVQLPALAIAVVGVYYQRSALQIIAVAAIGGALVGLIL